MTSLSQLAYATFNIRLTSIQIARFDSYMRELIEWNASRANLTAITEPQAIIIRHFLDSLSILKRITFNIGDQLVDIGTGAGFPGIPLAIVCPNLRITLMEATGKKVNFLRHIIELLGLENAVVLHSRAEDAGRKDSTHRNRYDVVTARAVARLPALTEYMLPLAKPGGLCVAMKGETAFSEAEDAHRALQVLGGKIIAIEAIVLPEIAEKHYLVIIQKIRDTPESYPRNAGTPTRKPIQ